MFDTDLKEWITYYVEDYYDSDALTSAIDALDAYLAYIRDNYNDKFYLHLMDMFLARDLEKRKLLKDFADIETFMGRMGGILNLKTSERFTPFYENEREQWTLAHLLKQAFEVVDEGDNLSLLSKPDSLSKQYTYNQSHNLSKLDKKYHYFLIYGFRNTTSSHFNDTQNLSTMTKKQIEDIISSMLVIELDLCSKFNTQLEEIYQTRKEECLKKSYDATLYVRDIESKYQKKCEDGFKYLDTYWDVIDSSDQNKKNIAEFTSLIDYSVTAFLGVAGTGKTTALCQLEYLFALKCKRNYGQKWIPVYIELKQISPGSNPLQFEIKRRLKYSPDVITQIIKDGNLILLLDGWNEIRNSEVKGQIRDELSQLINKYNQKVFITDRSENSIVLNISEKIRKCYLHELSYDAKKEYFEKYCAPEVFDIIKEQLKKEENESAGPKPIYNLKTPLMLFYFSKVIENNRAIPENFIAKYIELLFEREEAEQKDADDPRSFESMRFILAALALQYKTGEFFTAEALVTIGKAKQLLGFIQPDSMECLDLSCKMGILEKDGDIYQFMTDEFQDYFEWFGYNNEIDDYFRR